MPYPVQLPSLNPTSNLRIDMKEVLLKENQPIWEMCGISERGLEWIKIWTLASKSKLFNVHIQYYMIYFIILFCSFESMLI